MFELKNIAISIWFLCQIGIAFLIIWHYLKENRNK